jgi:hypothetical protein
VPEHSGKNRQSNTEANRINNKSQSNRVKIHLARYVECSSEAGKYEIQSVQSFFKRKMTLFWSYASHAFTQFYFFPFGNAQWRTPNSSKDPNVGPSRNGRRRSRGTFPSSQPFEG